VHWRCEKGHIWSAKVKDRTPPAPTGCPYCSGNKVLKGFNDLATLYPELAKEADGWDPSTVTKGGNTAKRAWRCAKGHTWEATVLNRTPPSNTGCPFCSGLLPVAGINDLATLHPKVANQADGWDPRTVTARSSKKLQWRCEKGHTWKATVCARTPPTNNGCPVCGNKKVLPGFNDLATLYPETAKEADGWDPSTVTAGSSKNLGWCCSKGHAWTAIVKNRTPPQGSGCPVCENKQVVPGVNDLKTLFPDLATEADGWDPSTVTPGSSTKRRWLCTKGHNWGSPPFRRTGPKKCGCPYCAGNAVWKGFNDLATLFPELAKEADGWDPATVTANSGKRTQWRCKKGHTFAAAVTSRTPPASNGCPICSGRQVLPGFNDLATLHPKVANQADGWDPRTVTAGSNQTKQWCCSLGHTWEAVVSDRTPPTNSSCPFCCGQKVLAGFNDLASLCPEVAAEADGWDPATVTLKSGLKKAWCCEKGHRWYAKVNDRTPPQSNGCPDCAESGFKPGQPAWFYLLYRPGEQQLGVTNNKEKRLHTHAKFGWQELEVVGPFPGDQVLALEKKLKKWLRKEVGLVPGTHENWFTASLEVRSLAELKARSGVETDLF
jgi:hypothetical protein